MLKLFRVFDGDCYWYSNDYLMFESGYDAKQIGELNAKLQNVEQFIGKIDCKKVKIFEGDILCNPMVDPEKVYLVIWSAKDCGFRKVPLGLDSPVTVIDEAFIEVLGTIHSYKAVRQAL